MVQAYDIDNTQRSLIHEAIKGSSDSWWHQWEDCWVIDCADSIDSVGNRLLPFVSIEGSEMLILALKETAGGRWSARMPQKQADWFREHMSSSSEDVESVDPWATPATTPKNDPWAVPATTPKNDPWAAPDDEPPF